MWANFAAFFLWILAFIFQASEGSVWEKPGCFKVEYHHTIHLGLQKRTNRGGEGHTRRISIADCVEFDITTNACRGYCVSYATPSSEGVLRISPHQVVTSFGRCCNIMETEDVKVKVMCLDGPRDLVFKSAVTCACYHCKKV